MKVRVDLYSDGLLIGSADFDRLDPPMGCAVGEFFPSEHYNSTKHAFYRDGEYADQSSLTPILAALPDRKPIPCQAVSIFDCRPDLDELEANLLYVDGEVFRDLFSSHPHYISYYQS